MDQVISHYPLSQAFKAALEGNIGGNLGYLSMTEIRHLPLAAILGRLMSTRSERTYLAFEEQSSIALRPFYEILGALTRSPVVEVVLPDLSRLRVTTSQSIASAARMVWASGASAAAFLVSCAHASLLRGLARHECRLGAGSRDVLYINANLWFGVTAGGSVGHISGVVNALRRRGFPVDFATGGGRLMVDPNTTVFELKPQRTFGFPIELNHYSFHRMVSSQLISEYRSKRLHFLYQRMSFANFAGVLLSRRMRLPLVLEYNGSEVWVAKHWGRPHIFPAAGTLFEDVCLRHAHVVVTVSEVLKDELLARGVEERRILVYPNCIDPGIFDPARYGPSFRSDLRARLGIAPEATLICFLGTFGEWHGVDSLAHAIARMAKAEREYLVGRKVHFLLVGDGKQMPLVRSILSDHACQGLYTLTGLVPQRDAPGYLAASDILVSPHQRNRDGSRFFGSPTKLFEYLAMGKAVIASNLDQIGDVMRNSIEVGHRPAGEPPDGEGRLGVLFEPGSIDELIAGLRFLIDSAAWRRVLGNNARREALTKYTWDRHVAEIEERVVALAGAGGS